MSASTPIPDGLVAIVVAGSCVLGIGMCATTLDSSVTTNPDDVVDLPADIVPIGKGTIEEIKRKAASPIADDRPDETGDPGEVSGPDERGESPDQPVDRPDPSAPPSDSQDQGQGQDQEASDEDSGPGAGTRPPTLLEQLQDWLAALFPYLVVAALMLLVLAAYRDRIVAYLRGLLSEDEEEEEDGAPEWIVPDSANEVTRAWFEMVRDLGVERDPAKTPSEYAVDAIRTGVDRGAVNAITGAFQEVRYGGAPVTSDRVRTVRAALDRIRSGSAPSEGNPSSGAAGRTDGGEDR